MKEVKGIKSTLILMSADVTTDIGNMTQRQEAGPIDLRGGGIFSTDSVEDYEPLVTPYASLALLTLLLDPLCSFFLKMSL